MYRKSFKINFTDFTESWFLLMSKVVRVRLEKKGISMTKSNFTTTMNNLRQEKKEEKNNNSIFSIDEQKFQKYFKII